MSIMDQVSVLVEPSWGAGLWWERRQVPKVISDGDGCNRADAAGLGAASGGTVAAAGTTDGMEANIGPHIYPLKRKGERVLCKAWKKEFLRETE